MGIAPRSQWTEEERVWFELFKAALSASLVADAIDEANDALEAVKRRIKPKEPPPLFAPLLKEVAERQQKDETESSFKVTK